MNNLMHILVIEKNQFDKLKNMFPGTEQMWNKYKKMRISQLDKNEIEIFAIEENDQYIGELTVNYKSNQLESETIPNISLGTVYRNLAALAEEGKIKQLSVGDSSDHFDGDISPHSHFYCEKCGKVSDVSYVADGAYPELEKDYGFKVKASSLVLCGVCKDCNKD
jgi:Fur family peroxide stress response transcriptional regulator